MAMLSVCSGALRFIPYFKRTTAIDAAVREADSLMKGGLIPLDSFDFTHGLGYELAEQKIMPDQIGILLAINQIFVDTPHVFGIAENQAKIKADMKRLMQDDRVKKDFLLGQIADVLIAHGVELKTIRLALVGMQNEDNIKREWSRHAFLFPVKGERIKAKGATKLLGLFGGYARFDGDNHLNAAQAEQGKHSFDIVVSGNVLNDPAHQRASLETYASCAKLLKQGGFAIHLTGYSSHNFARHIDHPDVPHACGQKKETRVKIRDDMKEDAFTLFRQEKVFDGKIADVVAQYQKRSLGYMLYQALWFQKPIP